MDRIGTMLLLANNVRYMHENVIKIISSKEQQPRSAACYKLTYDDAHPARAAASG